MSHPLSGVIRLISDRWVAGSGAGTFSEVFPYYQPSDIPGFFRHAHNEYFQILAEFGLVGTVLLGSTLVMMWFLPAVRGRSYFDLGRWGRYCLSLALLGVALHSLVDFRLRAPVICMLVASFMGIGGGWRFWRQGAWWRRNKPDYPRGDF